MSKVHFLIFVLCLTSKLDKISRYVNKKLMIKTLVL